MAIWELFVASVQAILQVIVTVLFGFTLSKAGFIDRPYQRWLSSLNMHFFTPCLLFSKIGSVISPSMFLTFWPIPCFYLIFTVLSWIIAHALGWATRLSEIHRRFVIACAIFSNTNSMPIAIIASLAVSSAGQTLFWGPSDTREAVSARGISYVLFFAIFGNLIRWSYGYRILTGEEDENSTTVSVRDVEAPYTSGATPDPQAISKDSPKNTSLCYCQEGQLSTTTLIEEDIGCTKDPSKHSSQSDDAHSQSTSHLPVYQTESRKRRLLDRLSNLPGSKLLGSVVSKIHAFMSPPLYAACLGLLIGLVPPLKAAIFDQNAFLYPSLTEAVIQCGDAAVPIILITLGAQLSGMKVRHKISDSGKKRAIIVSLLIRLFIMPFVVIPLVYAFLTYGRKISTVANDPVFSVAMVIVGVAPTAINLVQMTQVNGLFEEEMLRVLFWSYGVLAIPLCTANILVTLSIVDNAK